MIHINYKTDDQEGGNNWITKDNENLAPLKVKQTQQEEVDEELSKEEYQKKKSIDDWQNKSEDDTESSGYIKVEETDSMFDDN
jgi:hypothetical protein